MTNGKHDTKYMKELTGTKLKAAREAKSISRQKMTDILNSREDRPVIGDEKANLSLETLKKWEYGENPINIEWLPVICDVLDCDIGYLFGEYEEKRRKVSDVRTVTGLTERAIKNMLSIKSYSQVGKPFFIGNVGCFSSFSEETPLWIINYLLEDTKLLQLLYLFFIAEDMGGTAIVENTRSNAIFIELTGIFLNKRNDLKKLLQIKKGGNDNAT